MKKYIFILIALFLVATALVFADDKPKDAGTVVAVNDTEKEFVKKVESFVNAEDTFEVKEYTGTFHEIMEERIQDANDLCIQSVELDTNLREVCGKDQEKQRDLISVYIKKKEEKYEHKRNMTNLVMWVDEIMHDPNVLVEILPDPNDPNYLSAVASNYEFLESVMEIIKDEM